MLLWSAPSWGYELGRSSSGALLHWGSRCLGYHLDHSSPQDLPFELLQAEVEAAFQIWNEAPCAHPRFQAQGLTNDHPVGYNREGVNLNAVLWREARWPHRPGVLALTTLTFCSDTELEICSAPGLILDGDIELNVAEYPFALDGYSGAYDLRNALTHEIGHLLGLTHSKIPEASMSSQTQLGDLSLRSLAKDDLEGLCALYPESPGPCLLSTPEGDQLLSSEPRGCATTTQNSQGLWVLLIWAARRRQGAHR